MLADFFANFPAINISTTAQESTTARVTTTGTAPQYPTYYAISGESGFVSIINGVGTGALKIGDDGAYTVPVFKTILSFDTSDIPQNATITSVKLGVVGKQLVGRMDSVKVDIKEGSFATGNAIDPAAYYATASVTNFGQLPVPGVGQYVELNFPSTVFRYITRGGGNKRTQLRLEGVTGVIKTVPSTNQLFYELPTSQDVSPRLIIQYT